MNLDERREELLIWLADGPCIEAIADNWLREVAQLEAKNERLHQAKSSHMLERDRLRSRIWQLIRIGRKLRKALGGE